MQPEVLYETPTLRCNLRVLCSGDLGAPKSPPLPSQEPHFVHEIGSTQ